MKVYLTIDVETYSGDCARDIDGGGLGLGYLLEQLHRFDVRATFFMEALGATQWGNGPLREMCRRVMDPGHSVQLHIHPVTAKLEGFRDKFDTMWRQDRVCQARLIGKGLEILESCGIQGVAAFRAGSLAANKDTLLAMMDCGIRVGSNRDLDVKSSIESKLNEYFPVINDVSANAGVVDVPVTVLRSPFPGLDGRFRHLEICAVGAGELINALRRLERAGYASVCILTHPQEFFAMTPNGPVPKWANRRRLERLLDFLAKARRVFEPDTMDARISALSLSLHVRPMLTFNPLHSFVRLVEQAAKRLEWRRLGCCR
ncbi:MAG: hypothetical protein WCS01_14720 [bacterium]